MRLAGKLIAIFVLAVIVITSGFSYFTVHRAYQRAESAQAEFARETVDRLHARLQQIWLAEGESGLERFLSAAGDSGTVHFQWVWLDEPAGNKYRVSSAARSEGDQLLTIRSRAGEQNRLYTYCQVDLANGRRGGLEFVSSLESVDRQTREMIWQALLMVGLIGLLSIGFVIVAGVRFVARPLEQLNDKMTRIGRGDFSDPVQLRGHDELQQLGEAINEMCVQLERQQLEIKRESDQRLEAENQLRHADRLRTVGRLAAGLAHELGTPLGVISGRAAMLQQLAADVSAAPGKPPPIAGSANQSSAALVTKYADSIKNESDRIAGIVRQLLDFARPAAPQRSPTDLHKICRESMELARTLTEGKSIEFHEPADDSSVGSPLVATIDAGQIVQVLLNLLLNAIQAIDKSGEIRLKLRRCETQAMSGESKSMATGPANYFAIDVIDDGCGIEAESIPQLFEPFYTTKDVGAGTGLGLSVAYGIVREHEGWIEVESKAGVGSNFSVMLPCETT